MTEYINRNELLSVLNDKYESIADINSIIIDMKPADVVEREKVNKAIEEIEYLRMQYRNDTYYDCKHEVLDILRKI